MEALQETKDEIIKIINLISDPQNDGLYIETLNCHFQFKNGNHKCIHMDLM